MSAEVESFCIICNSIEGQLILVSSRGLDNLVTSSKKRRDQKFKQFQKASIVHIHNSCRTTYNDARNIEKASADMSQKMQGGIKIASEARHFDFKSLCFFCGKVCYAFRESVRYVSSEDTKTNILDKIKNEKKKDSFHKILASRLENCKSLVEANACYHNTCIVDFYRDTAHESSGRPSSEGTVTFIEFAKRYIERNKSDCQFSLNEIQDEFGGEIPQISVITFQLEKHFPNELLFRTFKTDTIIFYKNSLGKSLCKEWYEKRIIDPKRERIRIVEMAASIILEDIRTTHYDKDVYKLLNFNENNLFEDVPETLQHFLLKLILTHKDKSAPNQLRWKKKAAAMAHSLIKSVRPRSYVSNIMLSLSATMHKKFASEYLIDLICNLGFCESYEETLRFEASIINEPNTHTCTNNSYVQYVADNADHNTLTLDGKNTFHAMGIIQIVTPAESVVIKETIPRLKHTPSSDSISEFGRIDLECFKRGDSEGLNLVLIKDITTENVNKPFDIPMADFTWGYSKFSNLHSKGWNGFMSDMFSASTFDTSKIIPLPFIMNPPTDYDTVFTVLVNAAKDNYGQSIVFVTFDESLHKKARDILACIPDDDPFGLKKIRVRLGGFHTVLSFLISIGYLMEGSGLKELFSTVYAVNSVDKMLSGHAYARAIRAHTLTYVALLSIIFESINLTDSERAQLDALLLTDNLKNELEKEEYVAIKNKFNEQVESIKQRGPTAKLWIQYLEMVSILIDFIRAERSGDWDLHLKTLERMIPYFHASGHNNYAKSAHIYLQDMRDLPETMDKHKHEYALFTSSGYFTIRRSDKFWCGVWSDMVIEQTLMKGLKDKGGAIGRGFGVSVLSRFILTMVHLIKVSDEMEKFSGVSYVSSDQHIDAKESRVNKDAVDVKKFINFLNTYNPFPVTDNIMSVFSGIVGDRSINCYKAHEVGRELLKAVVGKYFGSVTFPRKNRVVTLKSATSTIKVDGVPVPINPMLLFERIYFNLGKSGSMENYLNYELAPYPLSLFTESGLKKNVKSQMYDCFAAAENFPTLDDYVHVIDGGFLLHKVVWHKNSTVKEIKEKYFNYVKNNYKKHSITVFDGYPDVLNTTNTKQLERLRRKTCASVPDFEFKDDLQRVPFLQEKFLMNENNKNKLIQELRTYFEKEKFPCKQAEEDADVLIVNTAIEAAKTQPVVIVGQDIDLLVLLNQLNKDNLEIYFNKPGSGKVKDSLYKSNSFKPEAHRNIVGFIHSFTGCDTTSGFSGKGKKTCINGLLADSKLNALAQIFYNENANHQQIAENGCKLIASIYKCEDPDLSLNQYRFKYYEMLRDKSAFSLEKLPPSEGAAKQHSYRVYLQVQTWIGNKKKPTDWGWKVSKNVLMPEYTDMTVIPEDLLKKISCGCKTGCRTSQCGCRKHGLKCTDLCTSCDNENCVNFEEHSLHHYDDSDEAIMELDSTVLDDEHIQEPEISKEPDITDGVAEDEASDEPTHSRAKRRKRNSR